MVTSAKGVVLLLGVALLAAAEPSAPQLPGVPLPPIGGPAPADVLPVPRALPTGPPRQEPAPAPREQIGIPNGGLAPPGSSHEEAAPMPHEQAPAPPRLAIPGYIRSAPPVEVRTLHQDIEGLRMEREAMLNEQMSLLTGRNPSAEGGGAIQLRQRITVLLGKAAQMSKNKPAQTPASKAPPDKTSPPKPPAGNKTPAERSPPSSPAAPTAQPMPPSQSARPAETTKPTENVPRLTDAPVDPLTLAQALFLAGDHSGALKMYRQLDQEEQKAEDRITIQYMTACCLRKLGKSDEASMLFREVANSGGNDVLVENAQWYLREMKERRELEAQLEELRQRRQSVTPRKP
jgi:TolA-binding protein